LAELLMCLREATATLLRKPISPGKFNGFEFEKDFWHICSAWSEDHKWQVSWRLKTWKTLLKHIFIIYSAP
jgi:hypothetical protein